ncbi:MAG: hypothetical protein GY761_02320 [Hyphomicrobiales bacterium]|nr:hypothetical protein [Hyphomicrobiales bacterium]
MRADSGFRRHKMVDWCERKGVGYIVDLAKNKRLNGLTADWMEAAKKGLEASGDKQRVFGEFYYAEKSWKCERRVIARIEYMEKGINPRYIVINLEDPDFGDNG